ncbi:MAG: sigma-70 family RNA polymerase sigma factor [Planctomycetota bacterium]
MTCSPSQSAPARDPSEGRERIRSRGLGLLEQHGAVAAVAAATDEATADAALATSLMDLFRRTGDREVFDCLVKWAGPQLHARVRSRLRGLGAAIDAQEVLQDTFVNIYRYPDRFLASRPGAFAAWSSTIVDNAIRRQLRCRKHGVELALHSPDALQEHADAAMREPSLLAQDHEEGHAAAVAFGLVLQCYLAAFRTLTDREQFVLQMVEVRGLRYAELAGHLAVRPEALKMIVFRARKRIFERTAGLLDGVQARPSHLAGSVPMRALAIA